MNHTCNWLKVCEMNRVTRGKGSRMKLNRIQVSPHPSFIHLQVRCQSNSIQEEKKPRRRNKRSEFAWVTKAHLLSFCLISFSCTLSVSPSASLGEYFLFSLSFSTHTEHTLVIIMIATSSSHNAPEPVNYCRKSVGREEREVDSLKSSYYFQCLKPRAEQITSASAHQLLLLVEGKFGRWKGMHLPLFLLLLFPKVTTTLCLVSCVCMCGVLWCIFSIRNLVERTVQQMNSQYFSSSSSSSHTRREFLSPFFLMDESPI